jgi:hypothetical protein
MRSRAACSFRPMAMLTALAFLAPTRPARAADNAACVIAAENGQRLRKEHKLGPSREQFLICARAECPGVVSLDCEQWLGEVEKGMASVVIKPKDVRGQDVADVRVLVDGAVAIEHLASAPLMLEPGTHTVRCEHAGFEPVEQRVELAAGERGRVLAIELHEQAAPVPTRVEKASPGVPAVAWVLGGVGVVGMGGFAFFGLSSNNLHDQLVTECGHNCQNNSRYGTYQAEVTLADVSLAVGAVALSAAIVISLVSLAHNEPAKTGSVSKDGAVWRF